jgi:hypothetical protein
MKSKRSRPNRALEFDPTPAGLVSRPLRTSYKSIWAGIRRGLLKEHGAVCSVCKHVAEQERHIHCHEVYSFPDEVVRLEQVDLLCWRCHDAVHFERTNARCQSKYADEIATHYCGVNGITKEEFERDLDVTFRRMLEIRESYGGAGAAPTIDYGPYQSAVDQYLAKKTERQVDEDDFEDFEMLPDHECPEDTAMWRECFD